MFLLDEFGAYEGLDVGGCPNSAFDRESLEDCCVVGDHVGGDQVAEEGAVLRSDPVCVEVVRVCQTAGYTVDLTDPNHGEIAHDERRRIFDLKPTAALADLGDRLVIGWRSPRTWRINATTAARYPVMEIADAQPVRFPGFDALTLDYPQLQAVIREQRYAAWRTALSSVIAPTATDIAAGELARPNQLDRRRQQASGVPRARAACQSLALASPTCHVKVSMKTATVTRGPGIGWAVPNHPVHRRCRAAMPRARHQCRH